MSSSKPSSTKPASASLGFWLLASVVVLGASFAGALTWPEAQALARTRSISLVDQGRAAHGREAEVSFRLATWLDPSNRQAYEELAQTLVAAGQPAAALIALEQTGETVTSTHLRIRILIELGQYTAAASATTPLIQNDASEPDLVLSGLALALGKRGGRLPLYRHV